MLKLDKFRKIAQDDNTVTMRHEDGHEMRILLKGIQSKIQREQLKRLKMAEGGEVDKGILGEAKSLSRKSVDDDDIKGVHTASRSDPKGGTSVAGEYSQYGKPGSLMDGVPTAKHLHREKLKEMRGMPKPKLMAEGGEMMAGDGSGSDSSSSQDFSQTQPQDQSHTTNVIINPSQPAQVSTPSVPESTASPNTIPNPAVQMGNTPVNTSVGPTPQNVPLMNPNGTVNAAKALDVQQQASREQQAVEEAKAKSTADVLSNYNANRANLAAIDQQNYNSLKQHTDDFARYMSEHPINPNAYVENMSTGKKITTALALIAGGFRRGFGATNNPALDFLHAQINRDIEAQKARSDQQKTIWGAYQSLYGDSNISNNLTKVSMNDIYTNKMNLIGAQIGTPQAKAAADAFAAQHALENVQLLNEATQNAGLHRVGGNYYPQGTLPPSGVAPGSQSPVGGKGGKTGKGGKAHGKKDDDTSLLVPNAENLYTALKVNPFAKSDLGGITEQFSKARQAESVLSNVRGVMGTMYDAAKKGGRSDYTRRQTTPGGAAAAAGGVGTAIGALGGPMGMGIGSAIGGALGAGMNLILGPMSDTNKTYHTNQARLFTDIRSALPNASQDEILRIVETNSPEYNDSPQIASEKEHAIKQFIKTNAQKGLLQQYHLWKN